jgi:hypothetical protein
MANGEWLTQLMAGLGGAFTGATQAKSRMAEEQEVQRKKMELENERARVKRIQELRSSPLTETSRGELLQLGETPSNIAALQELFTPEKPKAKPLIAGVNPQGFRYSFDPNTNQMTTSPVKEYRAPRETTQERPLTQTQRGAGLTFYNRYFNDPTLAKNPEEQTMRKSLLRELEIQFPRASKAELGYMMMGGMRGLPRGVQNEEDPFEDF